MAYDPLSDVSRKMRGRLIGSSAALLLVSTFSISVTDVPLVGLEINVPQQLLPTGLLLATSYFCLSFFIYALDDLFNLSIPNRSASLNKEIDLISEDQTKLFKQVVRKIISEESLSDHFVEDFLDQITSRLLDPKQTDNEFLDVLVLLCRTYHGRPGFTRDIEKELLEQLPSARKSAMEAKYLLTIDRESGALAPIYKMLFVVRLYLVEISLPFLLFILSIFSFENPDTVLLYIEKILPNK